MVAAYWVGDSGKPPLSISHSPRRGTTAERTEGAGRGVDLVRFDSSPDPRRGSLGGSVLRSGEASRGGAKPTPPGASGGRRAARFGRLPDGPADSPPEGVARRSPEGVRECDLRSGGEPPRGVAGRARQAVEVDSAGRSGSTGGGAAEVVRGPSERRENLENDRETRAEAPPQRLIMSVMFNSGRGGFRDETIEHPSAAGGATKPCLSLKRPRRS